MYNKIKEYLTEFANDFNTHRADTINFAHIEEMAKDITEIFNAEYVKFASKDAELIVKADSEIIKLEKENAELKKQLAEKDKEIATLSYDVNILDRGLHEHKSRHEQNWTNIFNQLSKENADLKLQLDKYDIDCTAWDELQNEITKLKSKISKLEKNEEIYHERLKLFNKRIDDSKDEIATLLSDTLQNALSSPSLDFVPNLVAKNIINILKRRNNGN